MEKVKILSLRGVLKKLIPTHMDNFEGFKTSVEEVRYGGNSKRARIINRSGAEDVAELLHSHDKI